MAVPRDAEMYIERSAPEKEGHKIVQIDVTEICKLVRTAAKIFAAIAMNVGFSAATYLFMKYVLHI